MGEDGVFFFFFFSSRRRHTRLVSDWSSDVCSSDLIAGRDQERGKDHRGETNNDRRPAIHRFFCGGGVTDKSRHLRAPPHGTSTLASPLCEPRPIEQCSFPL